jgi:Asp-tRNA(Asn)/Glu-tRNA(Gln) amidotransferase A subunit family amidase
VEEATIAQVRQAMRDGRLTCRGLVDAYLRRIDAYDKNGPAINAIVTINPDATAEANELERRFTHRDRRLPRVLSSKGPHSVQHRLPRLAVQGSSCLPIC